MLKSMLAVITSMLLLTAATTTQAAVTIGGTRIIYEEQRREGVIKITNTGMIPVLLQAWIDDGDPGARPETIKVPFSLNPPVVRLDVDKEQTIRLFRVGNNLPKDRESLFWFNLLEIPPKPTGKDVVDANLMQMAFRTRIKLFYRPEGLSMTSEEATKKLTFSTKSGASGIQLVINNPTPYHLTLSKLEFRTSKEGPVLASLSQEKGKMITPFNQLTLPVPGLKSAGGKVQVFYTLINDFGGETAGSQAL